MAENDRSSGHGNHQGTIGFWSTQTLRKRIKRDKIVRPYSDKSLTREANHRLSMGDEYFITRSATEAAVTEGSIRKLKRGDTFSIPPGHFGFLVTEERIRMPSDAIGFLSIQTDIKFLGLVNISGFHVDPGSDGKIIFSVFNAGPDAVHVKRGDQIFRLWIASLDEEDERPRAGKSHGGIPSKVVNQISGDLESLKTLIARVEAMETRVNLHGGMFRACVGLLIAILVGLIVLGLQGQTNIIVNLPDDTAIEPAATSTVGRQGSANPRNRRNYVVEGKHPTFRNQVRPAK